MKTIFRLMTIAFVAGLAGACNKDEAELPAPYSKITGLHGTWVVGSVNQVDEKTPLKESIDLSNFFLVAGEDQLTIEFDSTDFSYSVIEGAGINPFGTQGVWDFDNRKYPSLIYLIPESDTLVDTVSIGLGAPVFEHSSNLTLSYSKTCPGEGGVEEPVVTYDFEFNRN